MVAALSRKRIGALLPRRSVTLLQTGAALDGFGRGGLGFPQRLGHNLQHHRGNALSHAGRAGADRDSSLIHLQLHAPDIFHANAVKVSVSDTGPGIPPEFHLEVFDDFYRLKQNESKSDGMGLGLSIARRLVANMGGKIWVESDPGAGCKFSFLLPLKPAVNAGEVNKTHGGKSE